MGRLTQWLLPIFDLEFELSSPLLPNVFIPFAILEDWPGPAASARYAIVNLEAKHRAALRECVTIVLSVVKRLNQLSAEKVT